MIDVPHRLSFELRCKCAREDEIVDDTAPPGASNACATCGTLYVNDSGVWRNPLTISKRKRDKLFALGRVHQVTRSLE